jgi:hypothetical protein
MNYCDQVQISEKGQNERMFCSASVNYDKSNAGKEDWNKYLQNIRPKDKTKSTKTQTAKNKTLQKKIEAKKEELNNLRALKKLNKQIKNQKEDMKDEDEDEDEDEKEKEKEEEEEDESSCCIIL